MSRFDPETLTLASERDRIAREYDDTETEIGELEAKLDGDEDIDADRVLATKRRKEAYLGKLDQMGREVSALINEYDADATVRVRGLSAGEYAKVENRTAEAAERVGGEAGAPGSGRLVFAAGGLLDAPFYDGDPDDLQAKLDCLAGQPIGVRKWLEDLVTERTVADEKNWRDSAGRSSGERSTT